MALLQCTCSPFSTLFRSCPKRLLCMDGLIPTPSYKLPVLVCTMARLHGFSPVSYTVRIPRSERLLCLDGLIPSPSHELPMPVCTMALLQCTCPDFDRVRL